MHLVFIPYGIQERVDAFLMSLQCQMFPWRRVEVSTGKEHIIGIQGSLRPSLFGVYEYVFPKEQLGDVLASMQVNNDIDACTRDKGKVFMFQASVLRKMLKCRKVPEKFIDLSGNEFDIKNYPPGRMLMLQGVALFIIGIRDDKMDVMNNVPFGDPQIITDVYQEWL